MFRGDYGFLSSMAAPKYFFRPDMPRTEQYMDGTGRIMSTFKPGTYFQFKAFQGGHLDQEQHFIPDHVPCPALRGANIQRPGHAAGYLDVTQEAERTGLTEEAIIDYFLNDPRMKHKVGKEYVLVDNSGNPCEYGDMEIEPEERLVIEEEREGSGATDRWLEKRGELFFCKLCGASGAWKGHRGHLRSRNHRERKAAKEAA